MKTVSRTQLSNGLTVLCEENHQAPVVALQTWVRAGSADEADDVAGVAHLHEHMLFKGTKRRRVGELARTIEAAGGEINAWTSFDQTVYHVVLAARELATGVDVLADALRHSTFDPEELRRESEVVLEEIHRAGDNPSRRASNALLALAYEKHPYRRPVLGYEHTVRALQRQQILKFYQQYYRPEQVTVVAVGDFQTDALMGLIGEHFGDWEGVDSASPRPRRSPEPPQERLRVHVLREDVKEARISLAWHGPSMSHPDLAAVDALALILGHGESSRLYESVRRREQLVNDAFAYAYTPQDPGLFMVGGGLPSKDILPALEALTRTCCQLREQCVSAAELEKVQVLMLSEVAYQQETVQGQARKRGFYEVVGGDYNYETVYLEALRALTPSRLREVAHRLLHPCPAVVIQMPQEAVAVESEQVAEVVRGACKSVARRQPPSPQADGVTRVQLPNGAVILVKPENSPVVAMRAVALGGQRWETASKAGLTHLFTSLWGEATCHLPRAALAERVALLGGSMAAFAGRNTSGLRAEFIAEKAAPGLSLFCETILYPQLEESDLQRERAVLLEHIRNREDNPAAVAFDLFARALHPLHPYGYRLTGSQNTVESVQLADLHAYRQQFLTPDKLVVSVVGGIDAEHAIEVLSAALHGAAGPALPAVVAPDPAPEKPRRVRHALARKQAHVVIGAMGTTLHDEERYALEVVTTILSGQGGRLFLDLRDAQSLAYSISSGNVEGLDPGHVMVHLGTSPDKVERARAGVYQHLERLSREPCQEQELARAKRYLMGSNAIDLQRCGARAMLMALHERYNQGYAYYHEYPHHIAKVSVESVQRVAQKYFNADAFVEVVVGPETTS